MVKNLQEERKYLASVINAKEDKYVVKGTANDKKNETISKPMSKSEADNLATSLKEDMKKAIPKYRWLKDIKVEKV